MLLTRAWMHRKTEFFRNSDPPLSPFCTCLRKHATPKLPRDIPRFLWQKQLIPFKKSYPYSRLPRLWIPTRYDATRGGVGLLFVSKDPGFKVVVWLRPRNLSLAFCGVVNIHTHRPQRPPRDWLFIAVVNLLRTSQLELPAVQGRRLLAQQLHTPRLLRRGGPVGVVASPEQNPNNLRLVFH